MNTQIFKQAQELVAENSAAILTGTAVVGVVTTAVLTGRASFKAAQILDDESVRRVEQQEPNLEVLGLDKAKLLAPLFIPPVLSGAGTIAAIIMSYRISTSKSAALAAAYAISERSYAEYKSKVLDQVTPKKAGEIQDAVDKQKIDDNPPPVASAFIIGDSEVLCLDAFSGQYFRSTVENIRRAENDMNAQIQQHQIIGLGDYYESLGIKQFDMAEGFYWTINNNCQLEYSTQMTDDGRPCLVVSFVNVPRPNMDYDKYA